MNRSVASGRRNGSCGTDIKQFCRTADREISELLIPSTVMVPDVGSRSRRRERTKVLLPLDPRSCQLQHLFVLVLRGAYLPVLPQSMSLWPASILRLISERASLPGLDHF